MALSFQFIPATRQDAFWSCRLRNRGGQCCCALFWTFRASNTLRPPIISVISSSGTKECGRTTGIENLILDIFCTMKRSHILSKGLSISKLICAIKYWCTRCLKPSQEPSSTSTNSLSPVGRNIPSAEDFAKMWVEFCERFTPWLLPQRGHGTELMPLLRLSKAFWFIILSV